MFGGIAPNQLQLETDKAATGVAASRVLVICQEPDTKDMSTLNH